MKKINLFNNKKAISEYVLWWLIFKLGFTIAVCFSVLFIVQSGYSNVNYGLRDIDAKIVANTFMNSKLFMRYDSKIDRLYTGNIDPVKWEDTVKLQDELNNALNTNNINYMAMNITLFKGANIIGSVYYNELKYIEWNTYHEGDFKSGSGGYIKEKIAYPVTYGEQKEPAVLYFEVLVPYG
jgi:hypothetical protein